MLKIKGFPFFFASAKYVLSYEEKTINVNNICRRSNTNITVSENRELYNAEAENAWEGKTNFLQCFLKSYSNSVVELSRREIGWACSCKNLNSMKVITLANLETWQKQQGKYCKGLGWLMIPSKKHLCDLGCVLYPCVCIQTGQSNILKISQCNPSMQTLQNYLVCTEVISSVFTPLGPHTFAERFKPCASSLGRSPLTVKSKNPLRNAAGRKIIQLLAKQVFQTLLWCTNAIAVLNSECRVPQ